MTVPRQSDSDSTGTQWVSLGLPLGSSGVDLRVAPRNRSRGALSELVNASFRDERVFGRRPGHVRVPIKAGEIYQVTDTGFNAGDGRGRGKWAYGHGHIEESKPSEHYPRPKTARGVFNFHDAPVIWTGDRLLAYTGDPFQPFSGEHAFWTRESDETSPRLRGLPAYFPTARHTYVADTTYDHYDTALGKKYRLLAFGDETTPTGVHVVVMSRETGQVVARRDVDAGATPEGVRCVFSKGRLVVIYCDDGNLFISSASEETPSLWSEPTDIGDTAGEFDVHYVDENRFLLAWRDGTNIRATWYSGETSQPTPFGAATILALGDGTGASPDGAFAITVARTGHIGVVYASDVPDTHAEILNPDGSIGSGGMVLHSAAATRCAVAARYVDTTANVPHFVGYAYDDAAAKTVAKRYTVSAVSTVDTREFFGCQPRSSAFRVGDETFIWLVATPAGDGVQKAYHLVGGAYLARVVGCSGRGAAIVTASPVLPSVNPDPLEGTYGFADVPTTRNWSVVLPHEVLAVGSPATRSALVDLDFLPPLRSADYGNATYFAGALVQTYDGRDVVEAGWTQYPEVQSLNATNGAGALTNSGKYRYRVYACWKNAAGETFRSPALTSDEVELGASDDTVAVVFNAIPLTNKPIADTYFEIYRTEDTGTTFYLVDRVRGNTFSAATISYEDLTSDVTLRGGRDIDPYVSAPGDPFELDEATPRGCEIIAAHGDRLWFAGGEIPAGQLDHSKVKEIGEGLGWAETNSKGTVDIDFTGEPTTSLSSLGEALVVFQRSHVMLLSGFGPDNLGNGGFGVPLPVASTDGATTHDGTAQTDVGVVYWSRGGPRLLTPGLQIVHIGAPVEPLASTLTPSGCVAVPGLREVRWYTADGRALLWDHSPSEDTTGRWSVWSGLRVAGACLGAEFPVLALTEGHLLLEDPAATDDGGRHFTMSWATWEIRPGDLVQGRNSILRAALVGRGYSPHTLRTWVFYDGSPGWSEYWTWAAGTDLELRGFGEIDTAVEDMEAPTAPDGVYRMEKLLRRNPFSTVRFRFDDGGSHTNTLEPHEVAVELGALSGIARSAPRTYPEQLPAV